MKHRASTLKALLLVLIGALPLMASADDALCEQKAVEVSAQLEHAQAKGNAHRVEGLERALAAIEQGCSNESVLEDAREDVRESLAEVHTRQAEFEQAMQSGDESGARKRRLKLEEATLELEEDTEALNALTRQVEP